MYNITTKYCTIDEATSDAYHGIIWTETGTNWTKAVDLKLISQLSYLNEFSKIVCHLPR